MYLFFDYLRLTLECLINFTDLVYFLRYFTIFLFLCFFFSFSSSVSSWGPTTPGVMPGLLVGVLSHGGLWFFCFFQVQTISISLSFSPLSLSVARLLLRLLLHAAHSLIGSQCGDVTRQRKKAQYSTVLNDSVPRYQFSTGIPNKPSPI